MNGIKLTKEQLVKLSDLQQQKAEQERRRGIYEEEWQRHSELTRREAGGEVNDLKAKCVSLEAEMVADDTPENRHCLAEMQAEIELLESTGPKTVQELAKNRSIADSNARSLEREFQNLVARITKQDSDFDGVELLRVLAADTYSNRFGPGGVSEDGLERRLKKFVCGNLRPFDALQPYWAEITNSIQAQIDQHKDGES